MQERRERAPQRPAQAPVREPRAEAPQQARRSRPAAGAGGGATSTGGATVGAGGGGVAAPDSMKLRMSFFVTRPPVPVPGTAAGSTPCSAAIRATTGDTKVLPFSAAAGDTGGAGAAGAATAATAGAGSAAGAGALGGAAAATTGSGCGTGAGAAGAAAGSGAGSAAGGGISAPAGAIVASTVPTSTVSPSCTRICVTTPSAGLGTSVSTLSVEISSNGSSRPIASPTWRSHFVTVPSETETPIWGITTSVCVPVDTIPPRRGEACLASTRPIRVELSRRRRLAG